MTRPNPIVIIVLCIVAISILAFTINDELNKSKKNSSLGGSKNAAIASPFVAYNPKHGEPGHRHDLPDGAPLPNTPINQNLNQGNLTLDPTPTQEAIATTNTTGMNPAHGQPGHRCDIAVGAPLGSAPANTQLATSAAPAGNAPATGMNPAHGQPGHRCDIAVGAPLNSPAPSAAVSTPIATTTETKVAPGLNPAHGQPGHRCDIAVGAPLNSAPQTATANSGTTTQPTSSSPFPSYSFPITDPAKTATPQLVVDSAH